MDLLQAHHIIRILPNSTGSTYVVYQFDPSEYPTGAFNCTLKFKVKDVDTTTGDVEEEGYDDEYQVNYCNGWS